MTEDGGLFLPCCYGYASTIRRAQGADLVQGCIFFDQRRFAAGRGYGYVAVSRFQSQGGCFLYGKLRRSDFLPVGDAKEDELLERSLDSQSTDEEDFGMEQAFHDSDIEYDFRQHDSIEFGSSDFA